MSFDLPVRKTLGQKICVARFARVHGRKRS
jgi:hypothetical protein